MKTFLTGFTLLIFIGAVGFIEDCSGHCMGQENWTAFFICLGLGLTSAFGALTLQEDN